MYKDVVPAPGFPSPLGPSIQGDDTNFAVYSSKATQVIIGLGVNSATTFPMNRTGDTWHITLKNLHPDTVYAYRTDLSTEWLLDPYAKVPNTCAEWNKTPQRNIHAYAVQNPPFEWEGTMRPNIPKEESIIYEMHVRGFNKTYQGMIDHIPYLKELGITTVELLPIYEFDECHCRNINPKTKQHLLNYWGYNPISYFAPKRSYSQSGDPIQELKTLVRELHRNKIEVILDVVYNHTGEGNSREYTLSLRGLDPQTYYLAEDFSGCGNTINANHPQVQKMILDSLRYFAEAFQVDGFRFDLTSTFLRGPDGAPLTDSPILQAIRSDPILSSLKLIAEPWDAVGLYHVGTFAKLGPWSEWNGKYRDNVRRFLKGTDDYAHLFADVLFGSANLYASPLSSINFITAHDGFTLRDLVTYQEKHNIENGEHNRDGTNQNDNWNCGAEGPAQDPTILALRERQMRNHLLALFISQGIPMLLMGDEYGHTRHGNNNPYPQDNQLNWFLWDELKKNQPIFQFVKGLIAFRKANPVLRKTRQFNLQEIAWHGQKPNLPNWSTRLVAFSTPNLYIAFNAEHTPLDIELPDKTWHLVVNTNDGWETQHFTSKRPPLPNSLTLPPHSALIASL